LPHHLPATTPRSIPRPPRTPRTRTSPSKVRRPRPA